MKYICLGYLDVTRWVTLSAEQQSAMIDECFAYDEVLKKDGHWAGEKGFKVLIPPPRCATRTVRSPPPTVPLLKPKKSWADS